MLRIQGRKVLMLSHSENSNYQIWKSRKDLQKTKEEDRKKLSKEIALEGKVYNSGSLSD